jgi:hypothetical protein
VSARVPAVLQPIAGAIMGLCGYALIMALPNGVGATAAIILWTAFTLARGERAFARWVPRLPMFGTLLGFCTLLLRQYALMSPAASAVRIIAAMTVGPAASVALAWVSRPVDGAAFRRLSVLTTPAAIMAMLEGVGASFACGTRVASMLIVFAYVLVRVASAFLERRFGGVRGSDLDAFRVVVETVALVLLCSMGNL